MPTDNVIDATTRSMIRNGRNSTAPIWNEAFSSLMHVRGHQRGQGHVGGLGGRRANAKAP